MKRTTTTSRKKETPPQEDNMVLQFRLPTDLLKRIDAGAERTHRTRPDFMRLMLERSVEAMEEKDYKLMIDFRMEAVNADA